MFYFMESATVIIFFARLVHFQGRRGGCEKEYLQSIEIVGDGQLAPIFNCRKYEYQEMDKPTFIPEITIQ
jgi:hypothetical protein